MAVPERDHHPAADAPSGGAAPGPARRSFGLSPLAWLALATVYIVWGSTYLAIRVVVDDGVPPLLGMGLRFLLAAALLGGLHTARHGRGTLRIPVRAALGCGFMGCALLLGGNGLVAVAEQTVPSGLAALLVATTALWLVLFRVGSGERPPAATVCGVLAGFAGVALLALWGRDVGSVHAWGILLIIAATFCWAVGSFVSGRLGLPADPLVATVWEMALGGLALVLVALAAGEGPDLHPADVSAKGWLAWLYLITVGSMVAYSAYVWLLANAPISIVSTYAYVNPAVAVLLGWAILSESVTVAVLGGGALVVAGVALVVSAERR